MLIMDLKFALRSLRRSPAFSAICVIVLALGIGANVAIFSVVDAVVLHPVPLPHPEQLVTVTSHKFGDFSDWLSWPDFADMRSQTNSFQDLVAYRSDQYLLTDGGTPQLVQAVTTTAQLFQALGVHPALGREFAPGEDEAGRNHVVILSHRFWRARFASDPNVLGRTVTLDEQPYTIIGVAPAALHFPPGVREASIFAPMPHGQVDTEMRTHRGNWALQVIGRLKPGATVEQAQLEVSTVQSRLATDYPQTDADRTATVTLFEKQLVGDQRPAMLLLLCAVGFVLLIACANVSNLLLARAGARQREIAIRAAVGANAARIVKQLLTESIVLAGLGGLLGLLLAIWSRNVLVTLIPSELPRMADVSIDGSVLLFAVAVSLATGVLFGLVPAINAARVDVQEVLKGSALSVAPSRGRARSALLIAETALAMVLLVASGLTLRSFSRLSNVDPGFKPHDLLTASLALPSARYADPAMVVAAYQDVQERLRTIPGAQDAALSSVLPLSQIASIAGFRIEGRPPEGDLWPSTNYRVVSPNYFSTMGTRIVRGRAFTTSDDAPTATPTVVINETAARRYWPNQDPVGTYVNLYLMQEGPVYSYQIIGVAADVRFASLAEPSDIEMYTLLPHTPPVLRPRRLYAVVRGPHAAGLSASLNAAVQQVDSFIAVSNVKTMDAYLWQSLARQRWSTVLLGVFAALALVLAVIGVYGVVSYNVTQRSRELAIRVALGAQRSQVLRMILFEGLRLTLIGVAIGAAGAFVVTRFLGTQLQTGVLRATPVNLGHGLYGISTNDPVTFVAIAVLLIGVSIVASLVPARRAMDVEPMMALRGD